MLMGRDQLCEALDRSHEVSEYLLERIDAWIGDLGDSDDLS
jgi:hypothetical protein